MARIPLNKRGSHDIRPAVRRDLLKRSKVKRRAQRAQLLYLISAIILALVGGVIVLLNQQFLLIDRLVIQGNKVVSSDEIASVVNSELSGSYAFLVPRQSIFFYPARKIEERLKVTYPRIGVATLATDKLKTLIVDIKERSADTLWCLQEPELGKTCYFTDQTGLIISKAPQFTGSVFFEIYGSDLISPVGKRPLTETAFRTVVVFSKTLDDLFDAVGIEAKATRAVAQSEGDFEVVVNDRDKQWRIILNSNQSSAELITNLSTALSAETFVADYRNESLSLCYVDLRFGKKVFYKFE